MLGVISILAYSSLVIVTAALVWALQEVTKLQDDRREWEPGTNPNSWRF